MAATSTTNPSATSLATSSSTPLAPHSASNSLKRTRYLFDNTSSSNDDDQPSAATTNHNMILSSTFIPPLYDRNSTLHKQNVKRRIQLHYPSEVGKLALQGEEDEVQLLQQDGGSGSSSKDSATVRAIREIRKEALDNLRSGEHVVLSSSHNNNIGDEGRLVLHREGNVSTSNTKEDGGGAIVLAGNNTNNNMGVGGISSSTSSTTDKGQKVRPGGILVRSSDSSSNNTTIPTPKWHAPWKLSTVISSHLGWVRSIAFDPTNTLFATGGGDRVIKIFDLAKACVASSDALKITLTGHISPVRGLAFSDRHPYLFSAGEDKMVKCWDLETNQVIRHYHGHLSGVFSLKLHPTLDLLVTGGRDAVARVWDMRTKHQIHCLTGHDNTVGAILTKSTDPQVSGVFLFTY